MKKERGRAAMKKSNNRELDDLIDEITVDAYGEEE